MSLLYQKSIKNKTVDGFDGKKMKKRTMPDPPHEPTHTCPRHRHHLDQLRVEEAAESPAADDERLGRFRNSSCAEGLDHRCTDLHAVGRI